MARSITPEKRVARAGKKVSKALSVFEVAADQLDKASAEHLAAASDYEAQAATVENLAHEDYEAALIAAENVYQQAVAKAGADKRGDLALVAELETLADDALDRAEAAQGQADNLRKLLAVS